MKTIFHDTELGAKLQMEGTFSNSKAQLLDDEGNVLIELEGSCEDKVRLKGIDVNNDYRETWINSVDNVIKIG